MNHLSQIKVAILAADGFEELELTKPREALENAGAKTFLISPEKDKVKAWHHGNWTHELDVDVPLSQANANDYDALLLPGGVMNPDKLRIIPEAIEFIRAITQADKPVAAICHGPWPLINVEAVKGKTMTSWASLEKDLTNAGAVWVNREVVTDGNLVTSRKPDDIPAFNKAMLELFSKSGG